MPHPVWTRLRTLATCVAAAVLSLAALGAAPALAASGGTTVSGSFTVAGTTAALSDVQVALVNAGGQTPLICGAAGNALCAVHATGSGTAGSFTISDVPAGSYSVYFYDPTPGDNDAPVYAGGAATLASATPISVGTTAVTVPVTTIPAGGAITGVITDSTSGKPVDAEGSVELVPVPTSGEGLTEWQSPSGYPVQSNGTYSIGGIPAGTYLLQYTGSTGAVPYPAVYLGGSGVVQTLSTATALTVTVGSATTESFSIPEGGAISGSVAAAGSNSALDGLTVEAFNAAGQEVQSVTTAPNGTYTTNYLLPGDYSIEVSPSSSSRYAFQFFTGAPDLTASTAITVAADQTHANVNFALTAAATISGAVANARGGALLPNVSVSVFDATGNVVATAVTGANGAYILGNLPAGKFYVEFGGPSSASGAAIASGSWTPEFYGGKPSLAGAKAVTISAGGAVMKINGAVLAAAPAAIGLPTQSSGKLSGLSKNKGALSFKFFAGSGNSADIAKVAVVLPSGLSWATRSLAKDLSLGAAKFTYAVKKSTLTVSFQPGSRGATLTVKAGGVDDTKAVEAKAKAKKLASEKVGIAVTSSQGATTSLSYTVKKPS